jgi:hypothetical protein
VFESGFLQSLLGLRGPLYFGGGSKSGPTAQQQALQTEQATTNANLNLEENEQRKVILNAMQGTRVFRGSALSRAIASNSAGIGSPTAPPGVSALQQNAPIRVAGRSGATSLLDVPGTPAAPVAPTGPGGVGAGGNPGGRSAAGGGR